MSDVYFCGQFLCRNTIEIQQQLQWVDQRKLVSSHSSCTYMVFHSVKRVFLNVPPTSCPTGKRPWDMSFGTIQWALTGDRPWDMKYVIKHWCLTSDHPVRHGETHNNPGVLTGVCPWDIGMCLAQHIGISMCLDQHIGMGHRHVFGSTHRHVFGSQAFARGLRSTHNSMWLSHGRSSVVLHYCSTFLLLKYHLYFRHCFGSKSTHSQSFKINIGCFI